MKRSRRRRRIRFTAFRTATVWERLRQMGAQVIDAAPGAVTPALLNKYLEITLRGLL